MACLHVPGFEGAVRPFDVDHPTFAVLDQHRQNRDRNAFSAPTRKATWASMPARRAIDALGERKIHLGAARFRVNAWTKILDPRSDARGERWQFHLCILADGNAAQIAFRHLRDYLQMGWIAQFQQRFAARRNRGAGRHAHRHDYAIRRRSAP